MSTLDLPPHTSRAKTVGLLCHRGCSSPYFQAVEAALVELGWHDGETVRLVRHTSDGNPTRLRAQADELMALKPDVIFAGISDPVEIGATYLISRSDRNFTGLTTINRELMPKRLELLRAALPNLKSVGYIANPDYALHQLQLDEIRGAAHRAG